MPTSAAEMVKAAKANVTEISCNDARGLIGGAAVFIDVREPPEWKDGTVANALCIPRGVLEWRVESEEALKDRSAPVVVYCKSGGRSALAAQTLQTLGFDNVKSLAGGYDEFSGNKG